MILSPSKVTGSHQCQLESVCSYLVVFILALYLYPLSANAENPADPILSPKSMNLAGDHNPYGIMLTRFPEGRVDTLGDFVAWQQAGRPVGPLEVDLIESAAPGKGSRGTGLLYIMVNDSLRPYIEASLDQYLLDLAYDGFYVELYSVTGGTAFELREFLRRNYNTRGLEGAVFVGSLPLAWYEMHNCYDDVPYENFPCDLFFMDLDGKWKDTDGNLVYDSHTENMVPEIYLGRLSAANLHYMGSDEAGLLNDYFQKNHLYRTGQLTVQNRALLYLDDDWRTLATQWSSSLARAYGDIVICEDPKTTTATDYLNRLEREYELIHVAVHSQAQEHWFKIPPDQWHSFVNYVDIINNDPQSTFYILYACSSARYTYSNYIAGWYIFGTSMGLAAISSSKTGAMLAFDSFYQPFGENKTIGVSFLEWFQAQGGWLFENWEMCWYYGLTLCGDPTLRMDMVHQPLELSINSPQTIVGLYKQDLSMNLTASGGIPPYSWQLVSGILPDSLLLDGQAGTISGTPYTVGCYDITLEAVDSDQVPNSDTANMRIAIFCGGGDANRDRLINVGDIVFLTHYIFHGGPPPDPMTGGDINCDDNVDFGDVVYLVNHVFKSVSLNPCANHR